MTVLRPERLSQRVPAQPAKAVGEEELRQIEGELIRALGEIRYGSIEIVIHDSRVIQIERRERVRFERADRGPR